MTIRRKIVITLAVAFAAIVLWFVGYIAWREHARSAFSGCNLALHERARVECSSVRMEMDYAKADTNTMPAGFLAISQRLAKAEADVTKWEAHVRKYGHLCGNGQPKAR